VVRWYATGGMTMAFVLLIGIPTRGRCRWTRLNLLFLLLITLAGNFVACSSGSGSGGGGNPGTTPGTYTVTVTGTSGSTTAMGTFSLTVQ
jgi:trimeric autotransporter adhesin